MKISSEWTPRWIPELFSREIPRKIQEETAAENLCTRSCWNREPGSISAQTPGKMSAGVPAEFHAFKVEEFLKLILVEVDENHCRNFWNNPRKILRGTVEDICEAIARRTTSETTTGGPEIKFGKNSCMTFWNNSW